MPVSEVTDVPEYNIQFPLTRLKHLRVLASLNFVDNRYSEVSCLQWPKDKRELLNNKKIFEPIGLIETTTYV
jgi:hypothetical protein